MSSVLVAGLGDVGVRAARQLLDSPGIGHVYVGARTEERAGTAALALHDGAEPWVLDNHLHLPDGIEVIASALPSEADAALARAALVAGVTYVSAADRGGVLDELETLDALARVHGSRIVVGCGLAPGLSDVLAVHAASSLDAVDEVRVARWGVAGKACAASAKELEREPGLEWRSGALVHDRHHGPELVWFPEPVGGRECEIVTLGVELLVAALPTVDRVSARLGVYAKDRWRPWRRDRGADWGSVRVEVWGPRNGAHTGIVYGVIEQTAVATGTVLGVTAAALAGAFDGMVTADVGAHGLGSVVDPVAFLQELARRGVKAAAFEGAATAVLPG